MFKRLIITSFLCRTCGVKPMLAAVAAAVLLGFPSLSAAGQPGAPSILIFDPVCEAISDEECGFFNSSLRLFITQSQSYSIFPIEKAEDLIFRRTEYMLKECSSLKCLSAMGPHLSLVRFFLGTRAVRSSDNYTLEFLLYDNFSRQLLVSAKITSDLLQEDLFAFTRRAVNEVLENQESAGSTRASTALAGGPIRLAAAAGVLAGTGLLLAYRGGQLIWEDNNSRSPGSLLPAPGSGFSALRGFFAFPYMSAQYHGQGDAGVAAVDDASAVHYNPAGLALLRREWLTYSHTRLPGGTPALYAGYAAPLRGGFFSSFGIQYSGDALADEVTLYTSFATDLGPWLRYMKALRLGVNIKGYLISVGEGGTGQMKSTGYSAGAGFDAGCQFPFTKKIDAGIFIRDVYSSIFHENTLTNRSYLEGLPTQLVVGFQYKVNPGLTLIIDGEKAIFEDQSDHVRLGGVQTLFQILRLRLGSSQILNEENARSISFGFGVHSDHDERSLHINYGFSYGTETTTSLSGTHLFSVETGF